MRKEWLREDLTRRTLIGQALAAAEEVIMETLAYQIKWMNCSCGRIID